MQIFNHEIFYYFRIYIVLNLSLSLFYDILCYLLLFKLGTSLEAAEEENDLANWSLTSVFEEQPLALTGSAKNLAQMLSVLSHWPKKVKNSLHLLSSGPAVNSGLALH